MTDDIEPLPPWSYVIYRLEGETAEEAIKAAGLVVDECDEVTFWPCADTRIKREDRVVAHSQIIRSDLR